MESKTKFTSPYQTQDRQTTRNCLACKHRAYVSNRLAAAVCLHQSGIQEAACALARLVHAGSCSLAAAKVLHLAPSCGLACSAAV